jgi:hypothetical protein
LLEAEEKEREAARHCNPVIAALKSTLSRPQNKFEADVQQLLRDGIEVLEGWLAHYHGLSKMLARQAAGRRHTSDGRLPANPVEGEIDHDTLTREIVARFPKILAAVAK